MDCQHIYAASICDKRQATGRLASCHPVTIAAHSEALVWIKIPFPPSRQPCYGLVKPLRENGSAEMARVLVTVQRGRIPLRVRNVHPHAFHLSRFQRLLLLSTLEGKELSLVEVSPGVVEVGLIDADQTQPEPPGDNPSVPLLQGDDRGESSNSWTNYSVSGGMCFPLTRKTMDAFML